jgi:DNA-binding CsgD family transcriptional regulator/GAF domain-containing protein
VLDLSSARRARRDIVQLCHSGLDSVTLRAAAMRRMRRVLPVDAFWFATADPATLLFTSALVDAIPERATPLFVRNEFLEDDVNKWTRLAAARPSVDSLYRATKGRLGQSPRYRNICVPLGFGDELRAALHSGGACWGFMCLHRDRKGPNFSDEEASLLGALAPHLASGLRTALLLRRAADVTDDDGPGLVVLADDLSLVATTPAGERWLAEIADRPRRRELPQIVYGTVARLAALERDGKAQPDHAPRARVQASSGRWVVVHAARLSGHGGAGKTAVILEPGQPMEVAPVLLQAYGLTRRETEVTQLVLRGVSTVGISTTLAISEPTVQQHLKAIFDKVGVGSRRELVAQIFAQQCRPHLRRHVMQA